MLVCVAHLELIERKKPISYDNGNPGPFLGHAQQKCGGVKPVDGICTYKNMCLLLTMLHDNLLSLTHVLMTPIYIMKLVATCKCKL